MQDPRVRAARGQPGLGLGLEHRDRNAAARERERDGAPDHAGADYRGLGIHRNFVRHEPENIIDTGPSSGLWCGRQTFLIGGTDSCADGPTVT